MRSLEQYREVIERAEATALAHPLLYKLQLSLLAALGIGYVLLLVVVGVACGLFVIGLLLAAKSFALLKFALLPLGFAYFLARALWFKLPPPQGRRVTAVELPALFDEIEQVRRMVKAKPVHVVLITPDFNAAVVQVPRLGLLGLPKRYLVIGLPLLACLPPYQVRAVLAHEFGHLAQNHAYFSNWIYRIRSTWYRIGEGMPSYRKSFTGLLTRFFDWYAPYFNAYSFVLARANEYQADRESASVTSREDAGDALVAVYAKSEYIESRFWGEFYGRAEKQAEPPQHPFSEYVNALRSTPAQHSAAALAAVLKRETGLHDTHPSLKDRLHALNAVANIPLPFQRSAAHVLLKDKRLELMQEFNEVWRESIAGPWKERHAFLQETAEKLSRFEAAAAERRLTEAEHWDYACATEALKGGRCALPLLDALLVRAPGHAPAYYARGRILLEDNQERGVQDVERAMQLDESARESGSQLLYTYFYSRNELARCDKYRHILSQVALERQLAASERAALKRRDVLEPHAITAAGLTAWMAALAQQPGLKRAWLARRRVAHLAAVPAYVLIVEYQGLQWVSDAMLNAVAASLPGNVSCLVIHGKTHPGAARRVKRVARSLIFCR
jgi:Zn-dependent protease with chaperone function